MGIDELMKNPLFAKFISNLARIVALDFQERAPKMTPDEIIDDQEFFPAFNPETHNYLEKKAGYVCRSPMGNMVYLIQPYDSSIYKEPPEELPSQWGFYWSSDPKRAKPFLKSATSPYNTGMCCIEDEKVYRSKADNNVYAPSEYAAWWEEVPAEELI